jgi:hypothetical protein
MAYEIGSVNNVGALAHYNMLERIRRFMLGYGKVSTASFTGTGNGTMTGMDALPLAVTESWTVTCTVAAVNGGTFSVTGSVSGAQAAATVGTPYDNGKVQFTINDGTTDFTVGAQFTFTTTQSALKAANQTWTQLRYDTVSANRELILKGFGLSGTDEIYIGIRTYHDVPGDYYNFLMGTFTGYVSGNTFDTQPGARLSGVPAHNNAIDYWMTANGQRLALCLKVGLPVYESGYVGKYLPTATPGQYPSPLACGGMLTGAAGTRFSDTVHSFYPRGSNARFGVRLPGGTWVTPDTHPYSNLYIIDPTGTNGKRVRPTGSDDQYQLHRITIHDNTPRILGYLDGIYHITGFNNNVERVFQLGGTPVDQTGMTMTQAVDAVKAAGGRAFVVTQDVYRTGFNDFYAMEMA